MRRLFAALTLVVCFACVFIIVGRAQALTDAEYKKMLKNPDYAEADQELNRMWKLVNTDLPKAAKNALLKNQREWIKSGRDVVAREILGNGDVTLTQAYTEATLQRAEELEGLANKYLLMATADGHQGYYVRSEKAANTRHGGRGNIETGWLSIRWDDKKARTLQVSVDTVYFTSAEMVNTGSFGEIGVLKSGDSLELDDGSDGLMIMRFKNGGRTLEVITNQQFKENGWGGMGVTFDGTYTRQTVK